MEEDDNETKEREEEATKRSVDFHNKSSFSSTRRSTTKICFVFCEATYSHSLALMLKHAAVLCQCESALFKWLILMGEG